MNIVSHPLAFPILSLIFGVLILMFPRVLNYFVAIYLLLVGIVGLINYFQ